VASDAINRETRRKFGYLTDLGRSTPYRTFILAVVSVLAWIDAFLTFRLTRSAYSLPPDAVSVLFVYLNPVTILLPWFGGLMWFRRIRRASQQGIVDAAGVDLSYSVVVSLLLAAYIALGCALSVCQMLAQNQVSSLGRI
jgi:hypothetical protein